MTLKELKTALKSSDDLKRKDALQEFRDGTFGLEALPLLRQLMALGDDISLTLIAIECVAKLGPEALTCEAGQTFSGSGEVAGELECQLYVLGGRVWNYSLYANCYSACLDALVTLKADEERLLEYIHNHIGLSSQDDFLESVRALKTIESPEAQEFAKRAIAFWRPELDKTHTKKLEKILASK